MADLKTPSRRSKKGDRLKRLLDPLILPTVDEFPKLTCGLLIALHVMLILFAGQAFNVCWPAGSSGTLLQPVYDMAKELPGSSSPLFFFAPYVGTHVLTCGVYLLLDWWRNSSVNSNSGMCRPAWVQAAMAHRREAGDWGGQDLGLLRTLQSQLNVAPVTALIVSYMLLRGGPLPYSGPWVASCLDSCTFELPQEAPSLLEVLVHLAFCLVVNDAAYGYIHMQMHRHRALWKQIHSIHHEYKETFVTVGPHVHLMEFLTVFTLSLFAPAACGAHPFTCWVWYAFYTFISLEAHSGWRQTPLGWLVNLMTFGSFGGSMHHHLHHAVVWGNYAPFLTWFDKLMGTEVFKADEVHEPEFDQKGNASKVNASAQKVQVLHLAKANLDGATKVRNRSRAATPPPVMHSKACES